MYVTIIQGVHRAKENRRDVVCPLAYYIVRLCIMGEREREK